MSHRIFLAGASGAVGRRLVTLLVRGHRVTGRPDRGREPAIDRAVAPAEPDVVIPRLTDLPAGLDPALMPEGVIRTARLRREGTLNLVAAAVKAAALLAGELPPAD